MHVVGGIREDGDSGVCGRRAREEAHGDTGEGRVPGIAAAWPELTLVIQEGHVMSMTVAGFVKNGVVVPNAPLPEGARVEIRVEAPVRTAHPTPGELRRMPREQ